jgi:hypothetical protein
VANVNEQALEDVLHARKPASRPMRSSIT